MPKSPPLNQRFQTASSTNACITLWPSRSLWPHAAFVQKTSAVHSIQHSNHFSQRELERPIGPASRASGTSSSPPFTPRAPELVAVGPCNMDVRLLTNPAGNLTLCRSPGMLGEIAAQQWPHSLQNPTQGRSTLPESQQMWGESGAQKVSLSAPRE